MDGDARANAPAPAALRGRTWRDRAFDGLTWDGVALVATISVVNGLRRSIPEFAEARLADWLDGVVTFSALGLLVALPVTIAAVASYNLAPQRPRLRYPILALVVAAASLIGVAAHNAMEWVIHCDEPIASCVDESPAIAILRSWARYGTLCGLFAAVYVYLRTADESGQRALTAERSRARLVQRMEEARLRMLEAQIEPHFLFNTLANVRRLYQTDAAAAESMLDNLMRYLEVALPQMRASGSTIGREAALTEAFLAIQKIRMGARLAYAIEVPPSLATASLPPMMLLTLVENAIKHGLAPLPEGGSVRISASLVGNELLVQVADTGRGFAQSSGGGTGLANIRARLSSAFGPAGRLSFALNEPRGVVATIAVPHAAGAAGTA